MAVSTADTFYLPLRCDEATYLRGCVKNYLRSLKSDREQKEHLEVVLSKLEDIMLNPLSYEKVF